MKQNSLQYLLEKYREGTLNEEERVELESLTHMDEVMDAASRRAMGIIRRRVSLAIAAVMVVGAGVVAVLPHDSQEPLMAEVQEIPEIHEMPVVEEVVIPSTPQTVAPARVRVTKPVRKEDSEPVVICNNQCDVDSIISDIRKFLSV